MAACMPAAATFHTWKNSLVLLRPSLDREKEAEGREEGRTKEGRKGEGGVLPLVPLRWEQMSSEGLRPFMMEA